MAIYFIIIFIIKNKDISLIKLFYCPTIKVFLIYFYFSIKVGQLVNY